jgi:hypothetical protein
VALEQQEIAEEIVAALQFPLDELILFRQQGTGGGFLPARDISPREEMSQRWDLLVPSEVFQHTVQEGDADGNGDSG